MPRGKRLFKLIVKRVRGSKKGTSYTRKFRTQAELNAAKARYAKLGKRPSRVKPESKAGREAAKKAMKTPMSQRGIKEAAKKKLPKATSSRVGIEAQEREFAKAVERQAMLERMALVKKGELPPKGLLAEYNKVSREVKARQKILTESREKSFKQFQKEFRGKVAKEKATKDKAVKALSNAIRKKKTALTREISKHPVEQNEARIKRFQKAINKLRSQMDKFR